MRILFRIKPHCNKSVTQMPNSRNGVTEMLQHFTVLFYELRIKFDGGLICLECEQNEHNLHIVR